MEDFAFFVVGGLIGWMISWYYYKKGRVDARSDHDQGQLEARNEAFEREIAAPMRVILPAATQAAQNYVPVPAGHVERLQSVKTTAAERYQRSNAMLEKLDKTLDKYQNHINQVNKEITQTISGYHRTRRTNILGRRIPVGVGNYRTVHDVLFDLRSYESKSYPNLWLDAVLTFYQVGGVLEVVGLSSTSEGLTANVDGVATKVSQGALDEAAKFYSSVHILFRGFEIPTLRDNLIQELNSVGAHLIAIQTPRQ